MQSRLIAERCVRAGRSEPRCAVHTDACGTEPRAPSLGRMKGTESVRVSWTPISAGRAMSWGPGDFSAGGKINKASGPRGRLGPRCVAVCYLPGGGRAPRVFAKRVRQACCWDRTRPCGRGPRGSVRSLCLCSGGRGPGVTVPAGGLPGGCRPQTPPRPRSLCRCPPVTGLGPAARTPSNSSAGVKTPPRVGSRSRCGCSIPTALRDTIQPPTVTRQFLSLEDMSRTGSAAKPLAGHLSPAGRWAPLCPPFAERGLGAGTLGLQARVKACTPWPLGPGLS